MIAAPAGSLRQISALPPAAIFILRRTAALSFFRVRLWTQKELLEQRFAHYDQLDDDLKPELPLKRIWTVVPDEE